LITSGGKIGEKASAKKIASIKIQSGFQPRYALGLSFFSLLKLMQELGLAKEENNVKKIIKTIGRLGEKNILRIKICTSDCWTDSWFYSRHLFI